MFTCGEVAAYYERSAARCEAEISSVVSVIVETAATRARNYIGTPQSGWAPLSGATIEGFRHWRGQWITGKADRGFSGPDYEPLRGDTSELEGSISSEVEGTVGVVGSDSKVGLYQEMGTSDADYPTPPRSYLGKALMESEVLIGDLAGEVAVDLLMPKL